MRTLLQVFCLVSVFALLGSGLSVGAIWNVPGDSPTIQGAVDLASSGDVIEISCGTYTDCTHPDVLGWLNCVIMKPGLTLRGMGPDPSCVTIDATGGRGILCWNLPEKVTIENLTIRNGFIVMGDGLRKIDADGGAGVSIDNAIVDILNCRFEENTADVGGAILADNSAVLISRCHFVDNDAFDFGGGFCGSGVTLEFCYFTGNTSNYVGGGVYGTNILLESCLLEFNTAEYGGGGASGGSLDFEECSVQSNSAIVYGGGGVLMFGDLYAFNTDFLGNSAPAGMGDSGKVESGHHADLICCDTDITTWTGPGTINHDFSDCGMVVAQEDLSWGSVKALYR